MSRPKVTIMTAEQVEAERRTLTLKFDHKKAEADGPPLPNYLYVPSAHGASRIAVQPVRDPESTGAMCLHLTSFADAHWHNLPGATYGKTPETSVLSEVRWYAACAECSAEAPVPEWRPKKRTRKGKGGYVDVPLSPKNRRPK